MKKRLVSLMVVMTMLCAFVPVVARAAIVDSGTCGDNVTWTLDDEGTLTITGEGDIYNYSNPYKRIPSPFSFSNQINSIIIEYGVTSIGDYAFTGCELLTYISIPNSVISIGTDAFGGASFTSVNIPDSVISIGDGVFEGCRLLKSINISNKIESIPHAAFFECIALESVNIPSSVNYIEGDAFECCSSLASIIVEEENENFCSLNGILFNKTKTKIIHYPSGKTDKTYAIPNGITDIGAYAFAHNDSLTSIMIPISLIYVSSHAFFSCHLADVYYEGTEEQWESIGRSINNEDLFYYATMHYNSNGSSGIIPIKNITHTKTVISRSYGRTKYAYTPEGKVYTAATEFNKAMEEYLGAVKNEAKKKSKAVNTLEGQAKLLMEAEKTSKYKYLTFSPTPTSEKPKLAAYMALSEYLQTQINKGIKMGKIDINDSAYMIDAKLTKQIMSNFGNYSKYETYNGCTVSMNIIQFGKPGTGYMTVKQGGTTYNLVYVSKPEEVAEAMNELLEGMRSWTDDLVKGAAHSLFSEISDITGFDNFFKAEFEQHVASAVKTLRKHGFGNILRSFNMCSDGYETIHGLIAFSDAKSVQRSLSNAQDMYSKLSKLDYSDKSVDNFVIKTALEKVQKAQGKLSDSLYEYIYGTMGEPPKEDNFFAKVGSWVSSLFQCPVDFKVYDSEDNLIGYVDDGEVYYTDDIYIETSGDVKKLYVPKDMQVRIEMIGTDEGEFNYVLEEVVNGEPTGRLNYYNIPLTENATFEQNLSGGNLSGEVDDVPIVSSEGNINADEYLSAQYMTACVTIETECGDEGTIIGGGDYAKGDSVELTALASYDNYALSGWYVNDELVSTDETYRFTATENVTVKAEFTRSYFWCNKFDTEMAEAYYDYYAYMYEDKDGERGIVITSFLENPPEEIELSCTVYGMDGEITDSGISCTAVRNDEGLYVIDYIDFKNSKSVTLYDAEDNEFAVLNGNSEYDTKVSTVGFYTGSADVTKTLENDILTVDFYLLDDTINPVDVNAYFAEYDTDGALLRCAPVAETATENGIRYSFNLSGNFKIMFWDKNQCPITETIKIE